MYFRQSLLYLVGKKPRAVSGYRMNEKSSIAMTMKMKMKMEMEMKLKMNERMKASVFERVYDIINIITDGLWVRISKKAHQAGG